MSKPANFDEMLNQLRDFLTTNPESGKLWDLLTCLRGPDSPSETPSMTSAQSSAAYAARRKRKRSTVEAIRGKSGLVGGSCRYRTDVDYVTLPPREKWDHFDKHVERAARVMGLKVKIA